MLQGFGEVMAVPFLELPNGGVPWNGYPIQLKSRVPHGILKAHLGHELVLLALDQGSPPLALGLFLKLGGNLLIMRDHSPSLATSLSFFLFFRLAGAKGLIVEEG